MITYTNRWDCITCLIFSIPVAAMKSGSWKGCFSIPLFPCKINKLFWWDANNLCAHDYEVMWSGLLIIKQWSQLEFSPGIKHSERYLKIQSITISTLFINKCPIELHKKMIHGHKPMLYNTHIPMQSNKEIEDKWFKATQWQTPTIPGLVIATTAPLQVPHTYI